MKRHGILLNGDDGAYLVPIVKVDHAEIHIAIIRHGLVSSWPSFECMKHSGEFYPMCSQEWQNRLVEYFDGE